MKAALFQVPYPQHGDEQYIDWIIDQFHQLKGKNVDFAILPEDSNCLGASNREEFLHAIRGAGKRLTDFYPEYAKETGTVVMAGVMSERADGKLLNHLMVCEPDKEPYCPYTKNYPVEFEFQIGVEAGSGSGVFSINGVRFGASICFDFYFPELFARYADARIDVMVMSSLQRREKAERLHYMTRTRAFDLGCTVLRSSVAMPGKPDVAGRSMCVTPDGTILADAGGEPGVLIVEFDPHARFVQPASFDCPGQLDDYRETRLHIKDKVQA